MRVYIVTKSTLIFILVCINPQKTMIFFYKFYRNFTITFFTGKFYQPLIILHSHNLRDIPNVGTINQPH
ncbi:hypothetical protein CF129_05005 [Aeromonas dhakensis]|nr:hypothetical protein CF129_05005 [Aeromonas dhakensis]